MSVVFILTLDPVQVTEKKKNELGDQKKTTTDNESEMSGDCAKLEVNQQKLICNSNQYGGLTGERVEIYFTENASWYPGLILSWDSMLDRHEYVLCSITHCVEWISHFGRT